MKQRIHKKLPYILIFTSLMIIAAMILAVNLRFPVRYLDIIRENAGELEPALVLAVIMAESSFRREAQSHMGAQGLMQLMPDTAQEIAGLMGLTDFRPEDVWRPEINIAMGSFYLNRLLNQFDGNLELALAAYNAGQGNVNNWLADPEISGDGRTLDSIPFPETYRYLQRVMFNRDVYRIILTLTRRNGNQEAE